MIFSLLAIILPGFSQAQVDTIRNSNGEFLGFSALKFQGKSGTRGLGTAPEDLESFSKGNLKTFDFQNQYKKVFLGSDFFDAVQKEKGCDSLKKKVGKVKSQFVPVADGIEFSKSVFTKIEEIEGFYKFRNSKYLPGIVPNVDVWIKIESYRHGRSESKNCIILKFLLPEKQGTEIVNQYYVMRNDGILVLLTEGSDPDFAMRKDFFQYAIYPLNDPNETTHLVGKGFQIMGSFAKQSQCQNMTGLLFPMEKNGTSPGCLFFRKMSDDLAPSF